MYPVPISSSLISHLNQFQSGFFPQLTADNDTVNITMTSCCYLQCSSHGQVAFPWFFTPLSFFTLSSCSFVTLHLPDCPPVLSGCSFSVLFTGSSSALQPLNAGPQDSVFWHLLLAHYTYSFRDLIQSCGLKSTYQLNTQPYSPSPNLSPELQVHRCSGHLLLNR